jgi:hypothetical protein
MWKWVLRLFRIQHPSSRALRVTADAVELLDAVLNRPLWRFEWRNLEEIIAYKVDAITMDHLCLGFRESGRDTFVVTDEKTPGWNALNEELDTQFGVAFEQWAPSVAHPPFKENRTTLWRKPEQ